LSINYPPSVGPKIRYGVQKNLPLVSTQYPGPHQSIPHSCVHYL